MRTQTNSAQLASLINSYQSLISNRTGLYFSERKFHTLAKILEGFADKHQIFDFETLIGILEFEDTESKIWSELITDLTINETFFFRHFNGLEAKLLPSVIEKSSKEKTLNIWSAGCSTGEEPYSIAMVLNKWIPDIDKWKISILATDIDRNVISFAKKGQYREWSMRQIPAFYKNSFLTKKNDIYKVSNSVKRLVTFEYLNLKENSYPSAMTNTVNLDLIFCRNVTIYFEAHDTINIANNFYEALKVGGKLVVGHSEPSSLIYGQFHSEILDDVVVYTREVDPKPISKPLKQMISPPRERRKKSLTLQPDQKIKKKDHLSSKERRSGPNLYELRNKAIALIEKNELRKAEKILDKIILVNINDAGLYYMSALVKAKLGRYKDADNYCQKALEIDDSFLEVLFLRSVIAREERRIEAAKRLLHKLIYFDADYLPAYLELLQVAKIEDSYSEEKRLVKKIGSIAANLNPDLKYEVLEGMTVSQIVKIVNLMYQEK